MAILFTLDFRALRLFLHSEVFADEAEFQKKLFHALHIQAGGVMAVIVLYTGYVVQHSLGLFRTVQVTGVAGDAVVVAHVDSLCHLFAGYQCLIQFLAVARADGLHLRHLISDHLIYLLLYCFCQTPRSLQAETGESYLFLFYCIKQDLIAWIITGHYRKRHTKFHQSSS